MTYFRASQSSGPINPIGVNPPREQSSPPVRRTLGAQPTPRRLVLKIELGETKVEVVPVATTAPQQETNIAQIAPLPAETLRAEAEKGERSPRKKPRKHSRQKTHDSALPSIPKRKANSPRHLAANKKRREVEPALKDSSPRLKPQAPTTASQAARHSPRTPKGLVQSASTKTSPRFVVSPRNSPKASPRLTIGVKQPPSTPIPESKTGQTSDRPVQSGQPTPEKPPSVQERKAFFEGLAAQTADATVPLTRSATTQAGSRTLPKLEGAGFPGMRSTKPHS